ncbi:MAG: hypothetical protein ABGZ35_08720 [Planctomycetaceae bacterium]|jgi:hypothetical protein
MSQSGKLTTPSNSKLLWVVLLAGFGTTLVQDRPQGCTACRILPHLEQPHHTSSGTGMQNPAGIPDLQDVLPTVPEQPFEPAGKMRFTNDGQY